MNKVSLGLQFAGIVLAIIIVVFAGVAFVNGTVAATETRLKSDINLIREDIRFESQQAEMRFAQFQENLLAAHSRIDKMNDDGNE